MANNRICLTCGKAYEYCGSCPSSLNLPVWKNIFDTENCKTVFETVSDYAQKAITKQVAKERLLKCDTCGVFKNNIKNLIEDINKEDVKNTDNTDNETKTKSGNRKKSVPTIDD